MTQAATPAPLPAATSWLHNLDWQRLIETYGMPLLSALVVLLVGLWLSKRLANLLPKATARVGIDPMLGNFLRNVVYVVCLVLVLLSAAMTIGLQITPLLAVLGTAGLAVGLALKDSLSNIAAGVMLVTLRPFRVGDTVTVAGQTGTVREVRIFQTALEGGDKQVVTIPNNLITAAAIINLTAQPTRRVELVIGIGYGDDIRLARQVALEAMQADARVLKDPAADVVVYELGDNAVNLGIRCFVKTPDWFAVKSSLLEQIKHGFDSAGVSIPYPQQDMHLYLHGQDGQQVGLDALVRNSKPE